MLTGSVHLDIYLQSTALAINVFTQLNMNPEYKQQSINHCNVITRDNSNFGFDSEEMTKQTKYVTFTKGQLTI